MTEERSSIASLAARGVFWSIVQNWGGRLFTLALFVVLTRFLTPRDYGAASAALLVLLVIQMVAEFGFGDAIVQRRDLEPKDVNLPFFFSITLSLLLVATIFLFSGRIEQLLGAHDLSPILLAVCATMPLSTISLFQEMQYRRHLEFKPLAIRTFLANLAAGAVAVTAAVMGAGVWSLVLQTYVATLVGLIWLWSRPLWIPSRTIDVRSFSQLARFGASTIGLRLVDFVSTRLVEFLIVGRYGLVLYGVYAVGSRLYQTFMQLLQSALYDVSLTVLSKLSADKKRLSEIYLKSVAISSGFSSPIFMLVASLSPEICDVLFGAKWHGVEAVAEPLLLLGSLQCVQFFNGPYLSALGKPNLVFVAGAAKALATIAGLTFVHTEGVREMTIVFALGQLAATPITFGFTLRELEIDLKRFLVAFVPTYSIGVLCFFAVMAARPFVPNLGLGSFVKGVELGFVFLIAYLALSLVLQRSAMLDIVRAAASRLKRAPF